MGVMVYNNIGDRIHMVKNQLLFRSGRVKPNILGTYDVFDSCIPVKINTLIVLENDKAYIEGEKQWAQEHGIHYIQHPMSGISRPTVKQLKEGVKLIQESIPPILVRCRRGIDRTGYQMAAYRMLVDRWSLEWAYDECLKYGHRKYLYWWWKKSLEEL